MKTELVEFAPGAVFPLPHNISYRNIDGKHLFIATEVPTWIVVGDAEAEVIHRMQAGATVNECLLTFRSYNMTSQGAEERMKALLQTLVGFFFFKSAEPDEAAKKFRRLQIHITNRCNLRCSHCYVSSGLPYAREMTLDQWKNVISYMRSRYERVHVAISGGEPLMVRWLPELLTYAKKERGCDTAIITNGMLWTEAKARVLAPLLDRVAVSLDGATPAMHDLIRGPGSFEKTIRGIKIMAAAGMKIGLNVTLMQRNRDDLLTNLHPLIQRLGIQADVDIANFVAEGRGVNDLSQALAPADFRDTLAKLVAPFLSGAWKPITMAKRSNCGYGKSFAVYANGDVSPCLSPRFIRGNIQRDGVETLFDGISMEEDASSVDVLPLCKSCDLRYLCGGKCHLNHFQMTRVMRQNDCPREYRSGFYRNLVARFEAMQRSYSISSTRHKEAHQPIQ